MKSKVFSSVLLSIILPVVIVVIVYLLNDYMSGEIGKKAYFISVIPNLMLVRYYFIKRKDDLRGRLALLITFAVGICLYFLFMK
ncbi:MAG: hypothetical protein ACEPOV_08700 [Hyphomicrobiales bacterium]